MADYDNIPAAASLKVRRFRVHIDDERVKEMQNLVAASKLGPETYESLDETRSFGISRRWLAEAKTYWEKKFDWRATEGRINSFTNYEVAIKDDDGKEYAIHFTGIFSKHPDAIPICMMHGWPGSFLEFLKILKLLTGKYSADNLPYHVVVPSLPGYAFSTGPPQTKAWFTEDIARIMHKLMVGLGFSSGYVTHGGDIGSFAARIMCVKYEECKAMQLNFCIMVNEPKGVPENALSEQDKKGLARAQDFGEYGNAYARMHATRSGTIGLALSASPIALLAWIGEKFLVWTDTDPSIDEILQSVSLYWLTQSFPRAIYPYAQFFGQVTCKEPSLIHEDPKYFCKKPWGYSYFPKELSPIPVAWAKTTGNLIWTRTHTEGGHFAAMEKPDILLRDIEDFIEELK